MEQRSSSSSRKSKKDQVLEKVHQPSNVVYNIQYICDQNCFLVVSKRELLIYSIKDTVENLISPTYRYKHHDAFFWWGTHLIKSNLVAYTVSDEKIDPNRQTVFILDYVQNKVKAQFKIKQSVQKILSSRNCLVVTSLENIFILHFPTLKPIYNGKAGNGVHIIFDISFVGLTLVHNTFQRGELVIKNFTTIQKTQAIREYRETSMNQKDQIKVSKFEEEPEKIKETISVHAHKEGIGLVKMSPNGMKFVSGSKKGTLIRIFSSLSGDLLTELRVSFELGSILDIHFMPEGNVLTCLTEDKRVQLFNVPMSQNQLVSESSQRGYQIYQQENPKSPLAFLGSLNQNFKNQDPFAEFKLKVNLNLLKPPANQNQQTKNISTVIEVQEEHHDLEDDQHPEEEAFEEIKLEIIVANKMLENKIDFQRKQSAKQDAEFQLNLKKRPSNLGISSRSAKRLTNSKTNAKMAQQLLPINEQSRIFIENKNKIIIFREGLFIQLQYDPFNGGEMHQIKQKAYKL